MQRIRRPFYFSNQPFDIERRCSLDTIALKYCWLAVACHQGPRLTFLVCGHPRPWSAQDTAEERRKTLNRAGNSFLFRSIIFSIGYNVDSPSGSTKGFNDRSYYETQSVYGPPRNEPHCSNLNTALVPKVASTTCTRDRKIYRTRDAITALLIYFPATSSATCLGN